MSCTYESLFHSYWKMRKIQSPLQNLVQRKQSLEIVLVSLTSFTLGYADHLTVKGGKYTLHSAKEHNGKTAV